MTEWADAFFYHLYPMGMCGAPPRNDRASPPQTRLSKLLPWIAHARELGATALYLGPVFESGSHGYDTIDFFQVDRRLGTEASLRELVRAAHDLGLRVIFDAVFGHVGREFWAFRDLRERGPDSAYRGWFRGVDFGARSRLGDAFRYEHWRDAPELPRLDLACPAVREHLLSAVDHWVSHFGVDGLRLDSADTVDPEFLRALRAHAERLRPDFWLMGEVIHGDYRRWANPTALHSVTNYEAYKGLWSSHVDRNYFEIAHSLDRQFGPRGLYRDLPLYNFADNHDVNRVASMVRERAHLFSLHCLLFTMPGIPSVYAGSEWGIAGTRTPTDDRALRPCLDLNEMRRGSGQDLFDAIRRLAALRQRSEALRRGDYRPLAVASQQLAFLRQAPGEAVIVAVNAAPATAMTLPVPGCDRAILTDLLDPPARFEGARGQARVEVPGTWARVLRVERID